MFERLLDGILWHLRLRYNSPLICPSLFGLVPAPILEFASSNFILQYAHMSLSGIYGCLIFYFVSVRRPSNVEKKPQDESI